MKVLIVNSYDLVGGAARAAYRLHQALLAKGQDSKMLVLYKSSGDSTVIEPESKLNKYFPKLRVILDSLPVRLYKERKKVLFSPSYLPFSNMVEQINAIKPEVVHLHWIADGMMRIEDIAKINAPIIWTLHDDWAYTGGCHVKWECAKYKTHCGKCPQLGSKRENDLSHKVFERKKSAYSAIKDLSVVAVSRWLSECVSESNLLSTRKIIIIPNPLDTKDFSPILKQDARKILNLPPDKKLILFGANSATSDVNKGFHKLSSALRKVDCDAELVVFGSGEPMKSQGFKQKAHYLGHLHDNVSLRLLYSAADVMVVPSLQESFGQTASESMACGTPVVAFGATGLLDIVDHLQNGYLAKPYDPEDLAAGINMVLNANNYEELSYNARLKVRSEFDSELIADKYIALYQQAAQIK